MQKLTDRQRAVLDFIIDSIQDHGYPPTLREIGVHLGIKSTNGVNDHLRALERKGYLTREDMKSRTLRPTEEVIRALGLESLGLESLGVEPTAPAARAPSAGALTSKAPSSGVPAFRAPPSNAPASRGLDSASMGAANDRGSADLDDTMEIPILGRVAAGQPLEAREEPLDTVRIGRMLVSSKGEVFGLRISGDSMIEAGILDGDYIFVRKQLEARRGEIVVCLIGDEATCKYYFPEKTHIRLEPANAEMAPILIPRADWRETQILGVVVGVYRRL